MRSEAVTHDAPPMREPSRLTARFGGPWGWLVLAVLLQFIANGRWIVPQATWLAPIGWLVYLERSRTLRALALALVLFVLVDFVAWRPIIPAPGVLYYLIAGSYAVVYFLPFAVHRVLAARLAGFKATLVFPTAWVAIEFVFHRWITPYGSWFSLAYTQTDFLPLLQIAAITGVAGISFLITWFAAVVAWSLNRKRSNTQRLRAAWICGLALLRAGDHHIDRRASE
jgi:apolipoprotein N-acyltransferase